MNVSLPLKRLLLLPLVGFLLALAPGFGQVPGLDFIEVKMLSNTIHHDSFEHYNVIILPEIKKFAGHGNSYFNPYTYTPKFGIKAPGGQEPGINHLYYQPSINFIGRDTIEVYYHRSLGNGNSIGAYRIYYITVLPSFLFAENDYTITNQGQSVEIPVLHNDYGNGTNLVVSAIPNVNHGTATLGAGDTTIIFTPAASFYGLTHLNYTICDAQGSCDVATVSINVLPTTQPAYDSIFVVAEKNADEVVLLALDSNYALTLAPANGTLDTLDALVYTPDTGFVGYDKVIFTDAANGRVRVCEIRVIDVPSENDYLFDEVVFTPVDAIIEEIHLLKNDRAGTYLSNVSVIGFPNTAKGGKLTYLPSVGKGVYKYESPQGFVGVDYFKYRASPPYSGYIEEAYCYIVVANLDPAQPVFQMVTPENTPLVLGDHLPFSFYEFTEINGGDNGTIDYYPGYQTVTSPYGQSFSGYNMLVYTPDEDYSGSDEFEFKYCPGGPTNACPLVKIELEVAEIPSPQGDTLCAGSDCVWAGDTNKDGAVDIRDILPIGWAMGLTGSTRANGSTDWYGQDATDWNSLSSSLGFDLKFVDADGNGIISASDTTAITASYGKYHNLTPGTVPPINAMPFYIEEPDFTNVEPGDILYAPIYLGNDTMPAVDAYGITFGLEFDPTFFEDVNIYFNESSWMSYNSPVLSLTAKPIVGKVDAGITRTSGVAASGYGIIGVVEFIVIEDFIGNRPGSAVSQVRLQPSGLMNGAGQLFNLASSTIEFTMNFNGDDFGPATVDRQTDLVVFPNPTGDFIRLHLNGAASARLSKVVIIDALGKVVEVQDGLDSKTLGLQLPDYALGVYYVRAWTNEGELLVRKFQVLR